MAPILARRLGCPGADLDREIERRAGRAVRAIFEDEGEERFRDLESIALAEALGGEGSLVLACGGGILGRAANRAPFAAVCITKLGNANRGCEKPLVFYAAGRSGKRQITQESEAARNPAFRWCRFTRMGSVPI